MLPDAGPTSELGRPLEPTSMKNSQRAAVALIASALSLGFTVPSTVFAADAMHGDAMHKGMTKHKGMMKKDAMHKEMMHKDAEPAQ